MLEYELLELAYMLKPVRSLILKSVGNIPCVGALVRGSEIPLPRWLAQALESQGFVEIQEGSISLQDLFKTKFSQQQQREQLLKLEDFFYFVARDLIKTLEKQAKERSDVYLMTTTSRAQRDLIELFNIRFGYVLKAVRLGKLSVVEKSLSVEERIIAKKVLELVDKWMELVRDGKHE